MKNNTSSVHVHPAARSGKAHSRLNITLAVSALCLLCHLNASAQLQSVKSNDAAQNSVFKGMATFDRGVILPVNDTGLMNTYFLPPYWVGVRKEGAVGWSGTMLFIYRSGAWRPVGSGAGWVTFNIL